MLDNWSTIVENWNHDAKLLTIFQEFDEKTKDCWPLGRYCTFDVTIFKCHGLRAPWIWRSKRKIGFSEQHHEQFKGRSLNYVRDPLGPTSHVTKENWEEIKKKGGESSISSMSSIVWLQQRYCWIQMLRPWYKIFNTRSQSSSTARHQHINVYL